MTATELTPGALDADVATAIGETAAATLPAEAGWSVIVPTPDTALPEGALVSVGTRADDHVVSFVLTQDLATRILAGPPEQTDIAAALAPTLQAVAAQLGLAHDGEVVELDPVAVAEETPDHAMLTGLVDGEALVATIIVTPPEPGSAPTAADFEPITATGTANGNAGLEVLHDVQMGVTAELGRTRMLLRDILGLAPGSVIELDRAASAPVDVMVNGTLIARGEVVVIDEEFGIRITEIAGYEPPRTTRRPDHGGDDAR